MFGRKRGAARRATSTVESAPETVSQTEPLPPLRTLDGQVPLAERAAAFRPSAAVAPRAKLPSLPSAPPAQSRQREQRPPESAGATDPKTLIVGREISLTGEITACDRLVVEGRVKANLTGSRAVEIAQSGTIEGSAEVDEADIRGRFEGKLVVRNRLLVRKTGRVSGEVRYGELEIEAGGQISGDIDQIKEKPKSKSKSAVSTAE